MLLWLSATWFESVACYRWKRIKLTRFITRDRGEEGEERRGRGGARNCIKGIANAMLAYHCYARCEYPSIDRDFADRIADSLINERIRCRKWNVPRISRNMLWNCPSSIWSRTTSCDGLPLLRTRRFLCPFAYRPWSMNCYRNASWIVWYRFVASFRFPRLYVRNDKRTPNDICFFFFLSFLLSNARYCL